MRLVPRATAAMTAIVLAAGLVACSSGAAPTNPGSAPLPSAPSAAPTATSSAEVSPMPSTSSPAPSGPSATSTTAPKFGLTSSAFAAGDAIPRELTCDGANVSPPLAWTGVPAGTAALVLVVDDPDAADFVHWIVLDLPGADGSLARGVNPAAATPQQGVNGFDNTGYGGPCPPSGTHHYRFTLTALGAPLGLGGHPSGSEVRAALATAKPNVLGTASLSGTYHRG
jgi:Raf kinase inhibitor-like YbhB/YbcL family protein